jgi:hypothetical protein
MALAAERAPRPAIPRQAAFLRPDPRNVAMKTYKGTITPNQRDLNDTRSSGAVSTSKPKTPVLNDRRSTR